MVNAETVAGLPSVLRPIWDEQSANTAVALLLKPKLEDTDILLVKRSVRAMDAWSGHIALPGGKREPQDNSLKATAIRETMEETGIRFDEGMMLGVLSAVQSEPRRDLRILPFIVALEDEPSIKLNFGELESYLWVSYREIAGSKSEILQPDLGKVSAYLFRDVVVWGITYRIIHEFIEVVESLRSRPH